MKHCLSLLILLTALISCENKHIQNDIQELRFHNGKFRIAQFTDFHWEHPETDSTSNRRMVLAAVASENPDLCILTGDIVTGGDPEKSWKEIVAMMEETKVPYVILMGNHDPEYYSPQMIYSIIARQGKKHVGNNIETTINGYGNALIKILSEHNDSTKAVVYGFDSGNLYADNSLSTYDNIHHNQVAWYVKESTKIKEANGGMPVPSLAYFHICLPEYEQLSSDSTRCLGHIGEACCPSDINSGLFSAFLEQHDVMGTFVGHDHANDFIGLWKGVALAYGRQSGVMDEDETTPRGCRIVELTEGKQSFESWVWTPKGKESVFYYPSGITSEMEKEGRHMKAATNDEDGMHNGIAYTYYEGYKGLKSTEAMFTKGRLVNTGFMESIDISKAPTEDYFGYKFEGFFKAEDKGVYIFSINSDDGAKLFIDDVCIIDNDGSHSLTPAYNYVALEKGFHKFSLHYFENYMGQQLDVYLQTKNTKKEPLPKQLLYVKKK